MLWTIVRRLNRAGGGYFAVAEGNDRIGRQFYNELGWKQDVEDDQRGFWVVGGNLEEKLLGKC